MGDVLQFELFVASQPRLFIIVSGGTNRPGRTWLEGRVFRWVYLRVGRSSLGVVLADFAVHGAVPLDDSRRTDSASISVNRFS